jgi:hypothetical protein
LRRADSAGAFAEKELTRSIWWQDSLVMIE